MNSSKNTVISGDYCKCNACGHEGYVYGTMIGVSVSAPWCQGCGVNNSLVKLESNGSKSIKKDQK